MVGHSYGGWLAVSLGSSSPDHYRGVVNLDGIGFAVGAESEQETPPEQLSEEDATNDGDDEWLEAEIARDVEEYVAIGLRVDPGDEILRRGYQQGDDGRWHRLPTMARFVEIDQTLKTLTLLPTYTTSPCRIVTVIAEHRDTPDAEAGAACAPSRQTGGSARGRCRAGQPSLGHFPHIEMPEPTAERFSTWVGG